MQSFWESGSINILDEEGLLPICWCVVLYNVTNFHSQSGSGKSMARIGEGPILTLEKVERLQSGVYQCTAENNVGEPVTVDMRLDVLCKLMSLARSY